MSVDRPPHPRTNTIWMESGDQPGAQSGVLPDVIWTAVESPFTASMTKRWVAFSPTPLFRSLAKAIRVPSGDQAGVALKLPRVVSWVSPLEATSRTMIVPPRANTTFLPSGDQDGCESTSSEFRDLRPDPSPRI